MAAYRERKRAKINVHQTRNDRIAARHATPCLAMNGRVVLVVTTLSLSLPPSRVISRLFSVSFPFLLFSSLVIASWNVYSRDDFNKNGGKNSLKLTLVTDERVERGSRELPMLDLTPSCTRINLDKRWIRELNF